MCLPKENGGLGFRDVSLLNEAMLVKQSWRVIVVPDSLVSHILKARYFKKDSFIQAKLGKILSFF